VPRCRSAAAAFAVLAACALAGCSSSGGGHAASSAPPSSASSAQATALAARIRHGLDGLTSAHLNVDGGFLLGTTQGQFAYRNGTATASDLTLDQGSGTTRVITVASGSYAQLPAGKNTSGKPWVKVSSSSKNSFVRNLASTLGLAQAASSLPAVADLVATATSVQDKGVQTTGHEYLITIDPAHSTGTTLGTLLATAGQQTIPVDLFLDSKGRPVHVQVAVKLGSQPFTITVDVSKFNAPAHISAPPADQVSTD
jgi:hypothetical protein